MSMNLGINVVEVDGATPSIQGAPTSVAGFVIRSQRGVPGVVRQVSNFTQFTDYFGGYVAAGNDNPGTALGTQTTYVGTYAIRGFFDNGGSMAFVSRVVDETTATAAAASLAVEDASGTPLGLTVTAGFRGQADPGKWGQSLQIVAAPNPNVSNGFDLTVATLTPSGTLKILETWSKLAVGGGSGARDPAVINDPNIGSKFVMVAVSAVSAWVANKAYAVGTFVTNGGNVYVANTAGTSAASGGPTGTSPIDDGTAVWAYVTPSVSKAWQSGHAYLVGNTIETGGNLYQVTTAGTSAIDGPSGTSSDIHDGTVTWALASPWAEDTAYAMGAIVTNGDNAYVATTAGTSTNVSGATGPTGIGAGIADGTVVWSSQPAPAWQPDTAYALNAVVTNQNRIYAATSSGKSTAVLVSGPTGTTSAIVEGSVTWTYLSSGATPLANGQDDSLTGATLSTALAAQMSVPSPFDPYDIQLLSCPESTDPGVISAALSYCINRGDCMFVGHVPDNFGVPETKAWVKAHGFQGEKVYGALYFPYIQVVDPLGTLLWIPPVGHVMGVYARTDQQRGVWKAPAGNAAVLDNALDVRTRITDTDHTDLVKNGSVNAIRPITGAGIVVDSSRTLSTNTLWLYVNVRLLFNFVKTSLKYGLRWVVQEPNDTALWNKIKFNSVTPFLMGLWRRGAFGPGAPADVFTVKVDAENNPPANIQQGILNVEVYFYPSRPAETIVITVGQQEGAATASEG